jgi:hypothetical protein
VSAVGIERYVRSNESSWLDYRMGVRPYQQICLWPPASRSGWLPPSRVLRRRRRQASDGHASGCACARQQATAAGDDGPYAQHMKVRDRGDCRPQKNPASYSEICQSLQYLHPPTPGVFRGTLCRQNGEKAVRGKIGCKQRYQRCCGCGPQPQDQCQTGYNRRDAAQPDRLPAARHLHANLVCQPYGSPRCSLPSHGLNRAGG